MNYAKRYGVINDNRDFQRLFKKGKSHVTPGFVCYYRANSLPQNRLGLVAGKKVGNAVARNRAKRVIREAFRLIEPGLREARMPPDVQSAAETETTGTVREHGKRYDFVFVARVKTVSMKSTEVHRLMTAFMKKLKNPEKLQ